MVLDTITEAWQFVAGVAGAVGAAVVWVINKFYGAKRQKIDYKQHETALVNSITEQWKGTFESQQLQIDKLNAEVSDLRSLEKKYHEENLLLKEQVSRLTAQLEIRRAGFMHLPVPQWTLNHSWQFLEVNEHYLASPLAPSGIDKHTIVGAELSGIFSPTTVESIMIHSKEARRNESAIIEPLVITDREGMRTVWLFVFYSFNAGWLPVAHAGAAIPIDVNSVGSVLEQLQELP